MFAFNFNHILFIIFIFNACDCQRRIKDGETVLNDKKYMVYLLKASISPKYYDGWLCGGALVSTEFIVTSAACVTDVNHLYAIAGYNKYVRDIYINHDQCTSKRKKKIILVCTPKAYELKYDAVEKWSYIDIAVVKVESPYDFTDETYKYFCSYTPAAIIINYDMKHQEPGVDAIVFGWGHHAKWREQADPNDYNQEQLNYAPALIQNKDECKKEYAAYNGMDEIIDKYMICTLEKGNIDDGGETILKAEPTAQGCNIQRKVALGYEGVSCENANAPGEEIVLIDNTRKGMKSSNGTTNNGTQKSNNQNVDKYSNVVDSNTTNNNSLFNKTHNVLNSRRLRTRRHGICQNDHGGPLVTWVGSHEVLIGVASVFKLSDNLDCIGPYLFASTQCNGAFLDCILKSDPAQTEPARREICNDPLKNGFKVIESHISWKDHPDGSADNERNISWSVNTTLNLVNVKKETKEYRYNTTKLVNADTAYSNTTNLFLNATERNALPIRTTTVKSLNNIISTSLTNVTYNATVTNSTNTIPKNVIINTTFTESTITTPKYVNNNTTFTESTITTPKYVNNNTTFTDSTITTPKYVNNNTTFTNSTNTTPKNDIINTTVTN